MLQKFACLILYWFYKKCKMVKNIVNFGSLFGEIVEFACLDHYKLFHRSSILHEHSTAYSSKLGKMLYMIISSPCNLFKRYRIIMSSSSIALPLLNFKKWITSGHTQKHSLLWSHENCTFLTYYLRPFCRTKRMHLSPKSEKISTRVKSQRFSKWYLVLYVCNKTKKGFLM